MLRGLVKVVLLLIVVVAIGAFFLGYRWAGRDDDRTTARSPRATGTTGTAGDERERAREVGAEIGEKIAVGANAARREMSNAQLTGKIKAKMALDDTIRASAIDVDTNGSVVTLSGTVDSDAQRQRALQLARETDGVTSVVNRLRVK
jgi:hyperosmotically inducible protein